MRPDCQHIRSRGFTLIELCIAMLAGGVLLAGSIHVVSTQQEQFSRLCQKAFGQMTHEAEAVRHSFHRYVRQASIRHCVCNESVLEVYYRSQGVYRSDAGIQIPDRYVTWYLSGLMNTDLMMETGNLQDGTFVADRTTATTVTMAHHVTDLKFEQTGAMIRMILSLDNGSRTMTVIASAQRNNE